MEMTGEYRIPASREQVWAALNNPDILKQCIPGCQSLEMKSDTEMTATVVAKVGPVKAKFAGDVTLSDLDPPNSYTISGEGKGGVAGFAKGGAEVSLAEDGGETVLSYTAKAQVGGKLAQLGGRLIDATAKKMADQFFSAFVEAVGSGGKDDTGDDASGDDESTSDVPEADSSPEEEHSIIDDVTESITHAEEAVEEAAVRGTMGGAAMWGWIALAVVIVLIYFFYIR